MIKTKHNLKSLFYITLGYICFALGFIGMFLPVMPTTIFMIIALWAFSKGSKKMHHWLLNHPMFGRSLRDWENYKVIPKKAKLTASIVILLSMGYIAFFSSAPVYIAAFAIITMSVVIIYIITRSSERPADSVNPYIVVIGGANIDITGIAKTTLEFSESNIGHLAFGAGGVGRNIADNFARLSAEQNIDTYLLSAIGTDLHGQLLKDESEKVGINLEHCLILDKPTASYLSIVDNNGEMRTAINDMAIIEQIDIQYLSSKKQFINNAELIILETNITEEAIDYICKNFTHIPIFVDTVSGVKAAKIIDSLHLIHSITPNLNEAEIMSNITVKNDADLDRVATFFHRKGTKNLYITLGKAGIYISSLVDGVIVSDKTPTLTGAIVNSNGGGDAFLAGLAFAFIQKMDDNEKINFSRTCAFLTVSSEHTINPELNFEWVKKHMEQLKVKI